MRKFLVVVSLALVIGSSLAFYMFTRDNNINEEYVFVKAFQIGAFINYENAIRVAERNNGIVVNDKDIFRVYVSILKDDKAIEKMKNYYDEIGLNYYLKEIEVSKEFLKNIEGSEKLLLDSGKETYNIINLSVLSAYEELI